MRVRQRGCVGVVCCVQTQPLFKEGPLIPQHNMMLVMLGLVLLGAVACIRREHN